MNKDQTLSRKERYSKEHERIINFLEINCKGMNRLDAIHTVQRFYHLYPTKAYAIVNAYYKANAIQKGGKNE